MASPDESAGPEECFSEAQLKAMAGVFQGLLDKALTDRAEGGTSSEREENAERDPPGEMVHGGVAGAGDGQRVANFYLTHPFLDLVSGQSSSWQTAHARVGGVV